MTTDTNAKAKFILAKALRFGVEKGRLRFGKPGKTTQRYFLAKKGVRKVAHDKFNKNKKQVEFDEEAVRNPPKPKLKPKPAGPSSSVTSSSSSSAARAENALEVGTSADSE